MRYLVTGHTGFKGAWLSLWLIQQGHEVHGLSLDPEPGSLFEIASIAPELSSDFRADIRNADDVHRVMRDVSPEVVIHMAAQPLVRESYKTPRWTMETNVIGTMNVLEAAQLTDSIRAQLIITTDKVYRNVNQIAGYVEDNSLGGKDPYSASKAMADILSQSWIASIGGPPTAIARAGNVIGGGDVCKDRLLPDLLQAFANAAPAQIRNPNAVRPWQHVLDCLNGYLMLVNRLLDEQSNLGSFNIGPAQESIATVGQIADIVADLWGPGNRIVTDNTQQPPEAELLTLDSSRARSFLGWSDRLPLRDALEWTVQWSKELESGRNAKDLTLAQIERFSSLG